MCPKQRREWPEVAIIILNWNGWQDTIECLESLQRLTYPNYRMVVIDNGSTDGSMDKIKDWAASELAAESKFFISNTVAKPVSFIEYDRATAEAGGLLETEATIKGTLSNRRLVLIQIGANLGFAGGCNVGIQYAIMRKTAYIWLLNNDTVVDRDALTEMVTLAEREPQVGMVGSKLLYYDHPTRVQAVGGARRIGPLLIVGFSPGSGDEDKGQWESVMELDYILGSSLLAKREMIINVGLMDESYFFAYEDVEWSVRARQKGLRLLYCPRSLVFHKGSKSIKWKSPHYDYYMVRNLLFSVRKFHPYWLPFALLRIIIRMSKRLLRKEWENMKAILAALLDFFRNRKGIYSRNHLPVVVQGSDPID